MRGCVRELRVASRCEECEEVLLLHVSLWLRTNGCRGLVCTSVRSELEAVRHLVPSASGLHSRSLTCEPVIL